MSVIDNLTPEQKAKLNDAEAAWTEARNSYEEKKSTLGDKHKDTKSALEAFKTQEDSFEALKTELGIEASEPEKKQKKAWYEKTFGTINELAKKEEKKANDGDKGTSQPPAQKKPRNSNAKKGGDDNIYVSLRVIGRIQQGSQMISEVATGSGGKMINENQIVKLPYDSREWVGYLKQLPNSNWFTAKVENAIRGKKKISAGEIEDIQKEVDAAYGKSQKQIKDEKLARLQAEIDKLKNEE